MIKAFPQNARRALDCRGKRSSPSWPTSGGYTLVELIVVMVLLGIFSAIGGLLIAEPVHGFMDQARRARLVDAAALAQLRIARDLRRALPNSVRTNGTALELLLTADGDRYRAEPPGAQADRLRFNNVDDQFNTLRLLNGGLVPAGARLAIFPLPQAGANPYVDPVMTPAGTAIILDTAPVDLQGTAEYRVTMNPPHRFPLRSPSQRVFLVEGPVLYRCDPSSGALLRYSGYPMQPTLADTLATVNGVTGVLINQKLAACEFRYDSATARRNALVTLILTLEEADERVKLLRQVHVDNSP